VAWRRAGPLALFFDAAFQSENVQGGELGPVSSRKVFHKNARLLGVACQLRMPYRRAGAKT